MTDNNLINAIQIATGVAVVIGLVMVFIELRQAKSLSLAELTSQGYAEAMADFRTVMGENPAPIIAKSCLQSQDLQPDELVVLNAYYNSKITQITRLRVLELVADFGVPWQSVAAQQMNFIVGTKPGKAWFKRNVSQDPELYAIGTKVIQSGLDCSEVLASPTLMPDLGD